MKKLRNIESIFEPKIALPLIALIATIFRLVPLRYKYLFGYDPYFHLAYIEESLKAGYWINFYHLANAPWGVLMDKRGHPLGFYVTPVYIWKFLKIFGVSFYNAFRITPVIFGVLTVIFFYLSMLNFYGKKEAFFSAFFLSVMFGHIFRSSANYYRGDNYMLFWYSIALYGISLALTKTRRAWRYKRFAFYLIPAFASGFASIFWSAYYPIFVFLLGNVVFLAIGAFVLDKKEYFKHSIALTLSTAFGALFANYLGGRFRYGMFGFMKGGSQKISETLGLSLGKINDVYLLVHIKYLVPLTIILVVLLWTVIKVLPKDKRVRFSVLSIGGLIIVIIAFERFEVLKSLISGFGIFKEAPILETRHSTLGDLWNAYNIVLFLIPLYAFGFSSKKRIIFNFMMLGFLIPSIYLIYVWARFLFIASMAVALMGGVGLVSFYEFLNSKPNGKKALALSLGLLVLVPTISAVSGFERVYVEKPLINDHWIRALVWLKDNSNENDVVLAWWDYGAWIEYYARKGTVVQMGANNPNAKITAKYFLGNVSNYWLMKRGVDYVIVSYDTALKFGAILDTANVSKGDYFLAVLPLVSRAGALIFQQGPYTITARPGKEWNILINTGTAVFSPKEAFLEYKNSITKLNITAKNVANAYVYLNLNYGYAVLMNEETFNTTLARLMFTNEYSKDYQLVYSDGGYIKIFKFKHPNVVVNQTKNEIIFNFENATGTGLGVFGYLENGTLVFKKWYPVKDLKQFKLSRGVFNNSSMAMIQYIYMKDNVWLDMGIFRQ
ncbi:oligosaccharyl transferase, STT3 subunit [Thermococcus sp. SY098]|uniref:oligosaccharyl transferase, STT3 subunit n=1 Tax=Thermococcus sp. SY098 TaxID=3111325 RepID=UPI002D776BFA|nr:oligosaccharyl transferase, STT3 subunit [Thermococcus sp. SY098]WRS52137.1 oligosaccharyl transferase, STT3 subunit [Thermococcus sp. SY098]